MAPAVYEVTAAGYGANGSDATDDRVIWLIVDDPATQLQDLKEEAAHLGGQLQPDPVVGGAQELLAAADFQWPYDQKAFRAVMRHFARNLPNK